MEERTQEDSVLQKLSPEYLRHSKALCGGLFLNRCPTPPQFPAAAPVHIICSDGSNSMSQTWDTAAFEVGSSAPNLRWRLACERLTRVCPSGPHLWCNESGQAGQRKDLNCHPLTAKAPIHPPGTALQPRWSFGDAWLCSEVTGPLRLTLRSVLGCELSSGRGSDLGHRDDLLLRTIFRENQLRPASSGQHPCRQQE